MISIYYMIIAEDEEAQWILEEEIITDFTAVNLRTSPRELHPENLIEDKLCNDLDTLNLETDNSSHPRDTYAILCVDVGVVNLGLSALIADSITMKFHRVVGIDLLDITKIPHPTHIPECQCTLNHSKTFTDWMEHVFQYYHDVFEGADKIIIERQPPRGFVVVEQLIYSKYRSKCDLISPNSMHKFFGLEGDYEQRKEQSLKLGVKYIEPYSQIWNEFESFPRQHDITDSILIGVFWFHKQHRAYLEREHQRYIANLIIRTNDYGGCPMDMNIDDFLEQFRYKHLQPPTDILF